MHSCLRTYAYNIKKKLNKIQKTYLNRYGRMGGRGGEGNGKKEMGEGKLIGVGTTPEV